MEAKIDTGAFATAVPEAILKDRLGLVPSGAMYVAAASSQIEKISIYLVSLWVNDWLVSEAYHVLGIRSREGLCLLGRDLLRTGWLQYDGWKGRYAARLEPAPDNGFGKYPSWLNDSVGPA